MGKASILLLVAVVCVPMIIYLNYLRIRMFNSPDGERYMKWRMQSPLVPLSTEEIAEDEARKR
jgi:hypothetical protein